MSDKIIFLDIDGVINLPRAKAKVTFNVEDNVLDEGCCQNLRNVLDAVGAYIVVTSSWRLHNDAMEHLKEQLREHEIYSFRIVGQTDDLTRANLDFDTYARLRWLEIKRYITAHKTKDYVIIDDLDLSEYEKKRFVKTELNTGLTAKQAEACIKILNGAV